MKYLIILLCLVFVVPCYAEEDKTALEMAKIHIEARKSYISTHKINVRTRVAQAYALIAIAEALEKLSEKKLLNKTEYIWAHEEPVWYFWDSESEEDFNDN